MQTPLSFLSSESNPPDTLSLGDFIAERIVQSTTIRTFLDCLCSTPKPSIISPDISRPPLHHDLLRKFVSAFCIPRSTPRALGPNDRVMLVLPPGPENALALLAVTCYHTCAPVNASSTAPEIRTDAIRLNVKVILITREAEDTLELRKLRDELNIDIVFIEPRTSGPAGLFNMELMDNVTAFYPPSRLQELDDRSLVLHTSGTSGIKKVVPYTLRSLIIGTWSVVHSWGLGEGDVNLNMMPLFHVGGIVRNLLAPVLSGGSTIVCPGFDPIAFWNLSVRLNATWYYAAPTIHHAILNSRPTDPGVSGNTSIRMICNAAGGLLPSLATQLRDVFGGAVILPSYGMTECMPIASPPTDYQLDRPGCSGIACGPYLSIRDPYDREKALPQGMTGAVSVRGFPTFDGYEVSPNIDVPLDKSTFSGEGWFDSGDVGYMDASGYLYITGRSKEIINKGGEVISPFEVEEAIMTSAKKYVKNTLAFSIEHDVLQETIGVVIVPAPDAPRIGLTQLHRMLKDNLHSSKWPFAIVYMDDLPKNSAGKPLRIKLSARLRIGRLSDAVSSLHRHFEADVPSPLAPLTDPIPSSKVSIHLHDIEKVLQNIPEIEDFVLRPQTDEPPEAFLSVNANSPLQSSTVIDIMSGFLPGYCVPDRMYVLRQPLSRLPNGDPDFDTLKEEASRYNSSAMSHYELIVRDIVAELLQIESLHITRDSDFFLLGGTSLLLGKLAHHIRIQCGVTVGITSLFSGPTIQEIGSSIEDIADQQASSRDGTEEKYTDFGTASESTLGYNYDLDIEDFNGATRRQDHPLNLIIQAIPVLFFYPFKATLTWVVLLFALANLTRFTSDDVWERLSSLLLAIFIARLTSRIICPLFAILFKWIVIGKYQTGTHEMWSVYYLKWWIVNQSLRSAGRGIFSMHPNLEILYYRLLGAHIGSNVHIDRNAKLGEYDLLTFGDGCRVDDSTLRGFRVERESKFRLDKIEIGRRAVVNAYTVISPGSFITDATIYGPHSSSQDTPSPHTHAAYNRTLLPQPHWYLKFFVAWPIITLVNIISHIPWLVMIWLMIGNVVIIEDGLNAVESTIHWFSSPRRVFFHALARIARAVLTPLLQLLLGIIVKRLFGLNTECSATETTELMVLRRYVNSILLSQQSLKEAFSILGSHYEIVSIVYRAMGAKVGRRVYWPGSGIFCLDPELLEIGDDVVFGSRSSFFTTDRIGTGKIVIGDGAMIADRVLLLAGTHVGRRTVMGSGSLGRRGAEYADGSAWIGSESGEAICLNKGMNEKPGQSTLTPFGKAYHNRAANYFVFPYSFILIYSVTMAAVSAAFWSISPVAAAQLLRYLHTHLGVLDLFRARWFRFGILFGWSAVAFVIVLNVQALLAILWVIATKWIVIGRRSPGPCPWDKSSYCQRWQLHLTLSRLIHKGHGNGGVLAPLTGTIYIVWYLRALGAKIGKDCAVYAGGRAGLMTEPDLVELGNGVSLDDCSVVAHINSRGNFALNALKLGDGCAMRAGSRLLSGASMESGSMLCEHSLLTSGEVAEAGKTYAGWPAKMIEELQDFGGQRKSLPGAASFICPICRQFPRDITVIACGHVFCESCIKEAISNSGKCPVCTRPAVSSDLKHIYPSFIV